MVDTLLLKGNRDLSAPASGGLVIPDLSDGLFAQWHYDDTRSIPVGTPITSWTDRVGGFTLGTITDLGQPTRTNSSLGGRGAVSFDYNDSISPARGLQTGPGVTFELDAAATGVTLAAVAYNRTYKAAGGNPTSRLFASRASAAYYVLGNNSSVNAGIGLMTPAGNAPMYAPEGNAFDEKWFAVVVTITATESRMYLDDLPVMIGPGAGAVKSSGFRLGVNAAGAQPFTGYFREGRVYKKALAASHARALVDALRYEHLLIAN